ncbi:hypothetical protein P376_0251 [Streptomyces sp. HCCB10043]|nr:hypothetical protein P376_0251 [Streptomyces sp. HCCB10043]
MSGGTGARGRLVVAHRARVLKSHGPRGRGVRGTRVGGVAGP